MRAGFVLCAMALIVAAPVSAGGLAPRTVAATVADPATSPLTAIAGLEDVANDAMRAFVERAVDEAAALGVSIDVGREADAGLTFRRVALVGEAPPAPAPAAPCVRSPWGEVGGGAEGAPVSGTLVFSERQILQDQAVLANVTTAGAAPPPLSGEEFARHAETYARLAIGVRPGPTDEDLLAEGLPPDLLWLFRAAPQSTRGPFAGGARSAMARLAEGAAPFYAALAARILERCLNGAKGENVFVNIKEATEALGLEGITVR